MKPASEYPFVTFEVKQFIGREEVDLLPLESMGLLFRCMLRAWREGSVPAATADLARLVGIPQKKIEKLLPTLNAFFEEHDGRLIFPLVEVERERVTKMIADKTHAGTVSAQKRLLRKNKREENARKRKEQEGLNSRPTGVITGEAQPISGSLPIPIPEHSEKNVSEPHPPPPGGRPVSRNDGQHKVDRRKSERKLDPEALKKKFESDPKLQGYVDDAARELHIPDWSERFYALIDLATKFEPAAFLGGIRAVNDRKGSSTRKPLHDPFAWFVEYVTTGFRETKGS